MKINSFLDLNVEIKADRDTENATTTMKQYVFKR